MTSLIHETVIVNAPAQRVWELLVVPENWMKWDHTLKGFTSDATGELKEGNHLKLNIKQGPPMNFKVMEVKPQQHITFSAPFVWLRLQANYNLVEKDNQTTLTLQMNFVGAASGLFGFMKGMFQKNIPTELRKIKELAESK